MHGAGRTGADVIQRWRALPAEQRQAAGAAAALLLAMGLPWYQTSTPAVVGGRPATVEDTLTAFEVFTFVEAAVMLVAAAVLYLLWARSERRAFHLPGGDGWAITLAGGWAALLVVWRLFDKPDVERAAVGIAWGSFVTLGLAVALALAGQRIRAAHRPEPVNPMADPLWDAPPRRRRARDEQPADPTAVTEALRERPPSWEGEPPEPPSRAERAEPKPPPPPGRLF